MKVNMINRIAPSDIVEKILKRTDENPDDSPMEILDQLMETPGFKIPETLEIVEEIDEKDLGKTKDKYIIKNIQIEKEKTTNGQSNSTELEGNQR